MTLISHTHGRNRPAGRNILRRELQAAKRYGIKDSANPDMMDYHAGGWRYTYDGVVYITDNTSRHEITPWRIDGDDKEETVTPSEIDLAGEDVMPCSLSTAVGRCEPQTCPATSLEQALCMNAYSVTSSMSRSSLVLVKTCCHAYIDEQ